MWYQSDTNLVPIWFGCGTDLIPMWYGCGMDVVRMWYRSGSGFYFILPKDYMNTNLGLIEFFKQQVWQNPA